MADSDNPATEPGALDIDGGAAAFSQILEPQEPEKKEETNAQEEGDSPEVLTPEDDLVEVDIGDHKIKLPKTAAEKLEAERLMQADYTRKTMKAAEERKAAEAEKAQAKAERDRYAQGLQQQAMLLQASLQEQIDPSLIESNPVEYLKLTALREQRQAALQKTVSELQTIGQQRQAEAAEAEKAYLMEQQERLLAKLPEWKDEAKAAKAKTEIAEYLKANDWTPEELSSLKDHRLVVLADKARKFDEAIAKASAAAKKVVNLPTKAEKPGNEVPASDQRSKAFQRLSKTGSIEDAARAFATIL